MSQSQPSSPLASPPQPISLPVWQQLRWLLILSFILLAVIPVIVAVTITLAQTETKSKEQITRQLESIAELKTDEINRWLADSRAILNVVAANQTNRQQILTFLATTLSERGVAADDRLNTTLHDVVAHQNLFNEIVIYNPSGRIVAASDPAQVGKIVTTKPYFTPSLADDYTQTPFYEVGSHNLTMLLTKPLQDSRGQTLGVMAGRLDLSFLGEIMTERTGLGETGETYLVSRESNYLITPSRYEAEGYPLAQSYFSHGIEQALNAENGSDSYDNYRQPAVPVIGVYRWLPELQVALLAEMNESEALALFSQVRTTSLGVALTAILAAGLIGFAVAARISSPITTLTQVATRIAGGDLTQQAEISQRNEIGVLAGVFNSMTAQLRGLIDSLEQRVAARTQRLEILAAIGTQLSATLQHETRLAEVVDQVKESFDYYHVHIYIIDDERQNLVGVAGAGQAGTLMKAQGHRLPLNAPANPVAEAARTGEIVAVDNVSDLEGWLPNPLLPDTQAQMAAPIVSDGLTIGVLDVQASRVGSLDESDANLLRSLANQLAVTLTNARLFEQTLQAKEEANRAKEAAEAANRILEEQVWLTAGHAKLHDQMHGEQDLSTLANRIVQQLCRYLEAQIGALYIVEDDQLQLVGQYAYSSLQPKRRFNFDEGLVGQAATLKRPLIITDVPDDYIVVRSGLGHTPPRNIMIYPFVYDEQVLGVIELGTLTQFSQKQLEFLQSALTNIAIAFNTAQIRDRIDALLAETQRQAEELQAQGEELRVANEELEAQTASLRGSEVRLREKQVELEAINVQLEQKQAALDQQNRDLKTAQQELEQQAAQLKLANQYKSEFLSNMSHELRTPLNSLLILARLLADNEDENLTQEQVEFAQIILGAGTDLLSLINDILDLAKVESGNLIFDFNSMALADLAAAMQAQFGHIAADKGLEFEISLADGLPGDMTTDEQRLKQIVKNLLSNAFKFTASGSVRLEIDRPASETDLSRSNLDPAQAIAIRVSDTGIGISPDQQQLIFEAFQQADSGISRQYGGTGLGLTISRELVARLGGQIELVSQIGQGSTFTLYLPLHLEHAVEAEAASPASKRRQAAFRLESSAEAQLAEPVTISSPIAPTDDHKALLIVEDDLHFAKIAADFAQKQGFKSLTAADGGTALAMVKHHRPQAILLDLNLPGMSGWDVMAALKHDPTTRHIPVHIISGEAENLEAYRRGAMGYLTKPVSPEALTAAFQKIEHVIARAIKNLLLVEDDAVSRLSIKQLLGGSDVHISEAESGQAALDMLTAESFDGMILDLALPDMSGFELLRKLNEEPGSIQCPVIVYTGRDLTPAENQELMRYADRVIVKGVKSPERLLDETALFLHRVVADMPSDKQQTIQELYSDDNLFKDKKILIVDDDLRNTFALSRLLSDKGVTVHTAPNGQEALELLAAEPVDLILMDIMMPVLDGYEAIRQIRAQPQFQTLPILALTAKAMKGDQEKCLAAGADDYLPKPIDVDRLLSMLHVWLYQ